MKMKSRVEKATENVKEAQKALIAAVRKMYPVGTQVFVQRGHSLDWVKVTGHHDEVGEEAGLILGVTDTGEKCRFRDSNVPDDVPHL
jgi:hypothetical protein